MESKSVPSSSTPIKFTLFCSFNKFASPCFVNCLLLKCIEDGKLLSRDKTFSITCAPWSRYKKGKNIVIADLSKIGDTICNYLVICQGNSPSQVTAIVESVKEFTRKGANSKPFAIDGLRNAEWVAMDYSDILVHVFLPETRDFYNLENLWADAKLTQIPDID